jgi:hypothetical protein
MSIPTPFRIDSTKTLYYNLNDLFIYHTSFFIGCKDKKRKIIERKKIPSTDYVYANFIHKTQEWNLTNETSKKAQLLLTKSWVDQYYFPDINKSSNDTIEINESIQKDNDDSQEDIQEYECIPNILELDDHEKFKDVNGQYLDIEVRGERDKNKIYFNVKDIGFGFGIPDLKGIILKKERGYERGLHYKTFIAVDNVHRNKNKSNKNNANKSLFLTYKGLLRVLYTTRNKNAEHFTDWADDKLFTIQMGTIQQKEELGTSILGIKLENYKAVFNKYSQNFPCIYLLSLGKVKDLKPIFQLSDTLEDQLTVYKYGFTMDMKRRLSEHQRDYGKLCNVELEIFNYIDVKYTSEAEGDIRDLFESFDKSIDVQGRNELVVLNPKQLDRVKKEYTRTGREYAGATQILQEEILNLKHELTKSKHQFELQCLETEKYKTLVQTNDQIYHLEKKNYELQIQLLSK